MKDSFVSVHAKTSHKFSGGSSLKKMSAKCFTAAEHSEKGYHSKMKGHKDDLDNS